MLRYLSQCGECEKSFYLALTSDEEVQWKESKIRVTCPHCKANIAPIFLVNGSPIHLTGVTPEVKPGKQREV